MKNFPLLFCFVLFFAFTVSAQEKQNSDCPTVKVRGGGVPRLNETSYFTADVDKKGKELKIEYIWSVRGGKIIEGQGTETIAVKVLEEHNLSADIEIKGFPEGCPNTDSEFMEWFDKPQAVKVGDFLNFDTQFEKTQIEKLKNELQGDSISQIYVIGKFAKNTSEKRIRQRERKVGKYLIEQLGVSAERITITRYFAEQEYTEIWLVPAGAENPKP